jgi:hypothetical protein
MNLRIVSGLSDLLAVSGVYVLVSLSFGLHVLVIGLDTFDFLMFSEAF